MCESAAIGLFKPVVHRLLQLIPLFGVYIAIIAAMGLSGSDPAPSLAVSSQSASRSLICTIGRKEMQSEFAMAVGLFITFNLKDYPFAMQNDFRPDGPMVAKPTINDDQRRAVERFVRAFSMEPD